MQHIGGDHHVEGACRNALRGERLFDIEDAVGQEGIGRPILAFPMEEEALGDIGVAILADGMAADVP